MMEIVTLPQAPKEKPNERVIEYAKEMYDRALTGEITAIATVCVTNERKVEFDFRYDDPTHGHMICYGVNQLLPAIVMSVAQDSVHDD